MNAKTTGNSDEIHIEVDAMNETLNSEMLSVMDAWRCLLVSVRSITCDPLSAMPLNSLYYGVREPWDCLSCSRVVFRMHKMCSLRWIRSRMTAWMAGAYHIFERIELD